MPYSSVISKPQFSNVESEVKTKVKPKVKSKVQPLSRKTASPMILMSLISCISCVSGASYAGAVEKAVDEKNPINVTLGGYLMVDHDSFDSAFLENGGNSPTDSQYGTDIRRARLSIKTTFKDACKAKFQVDVSSGDIKIKDAYLQYKGWPWAKITVGKQKEPFGLEKLTSSRNLLMIERSLVTEALTPGRSVGISAVGNIDSIQWQVGYFKPDESETSSAFTGRVVWLPWQQKQNVLHLGLAFSERDYSSTDSNSEFRINEVMEVYASDSLVEGKKLTAHDVSLRGVEFLWMKNRYTMMGEWQQATVVDTNKGSFDYQGGYVQMSYQLFGGHRKYHDGELGSTSKKGWELTSRYSQFSLNEEDKEVESAAIGVNYTLNKNTKMMANYIHSRYLKNSAKIAAGNAISLRLQYAF